jgi:hypothetical protein
LDVVGPAKDVKTVFVDAVVGGGRAMSRKYTVRINYTVVAELAVRATSPVAALKLAERIFAGKPGIEGRPRDPARFGWRTGTAVVRPARVEVIGS